MPIGPFHKIVFAPAITSQNLADDFGPMSTPSTSSGMFSLSFVRCSPKAKLPSISVGMATMLSVGIKNCTLRSEALSRASWAMATLSRSTSDLPTVRPLASLNVYAIAPPMRIVSALSSSRSITLILSETFAPPRITTNGLSGDLSSSPRNCNSRSISNPATHWPSRALSTSATPAVEACARCAAPKASFTNTSASQASCWAKVGSLASSSEW